MHPAVYEEPGRLPDRPGTFAIGRRQVLPVHPRRIADHQVERLDERRHERVAQHERPQPVDALEMLVETFGVEVGEDPPLGGSGSARTPSAAYEHVTVPMFLDSTRREVADVAEFLLSVDARRQREGPAGRIERESSFGKERFTRRGHDDAVGKIDRNVNAMFRDNPQERPERKHVVGTRCDDGKRVDVESDHVAEHRCQRFRVSYPTLSQRLSQTGQRKHEECSGPA